MKLHESNNLTGSDAEHGYRFEGDALGNVFGLPRNLWMPEGYVIDTIGITADDDYGVPELLVEEWIAP